MKAESLYIQKLTYDENTGNEIIGLFPSEANPAIVSSYTYDAKRMGGAPTLTATIYSSEPLQWKKEEFVEYNDDRFFVSYTPSSTKDNSSKMWKSEITFTSRRELLDNTLFFDVVVDDVDTQNKDRYRSNQTKFTFGGTIHEFVARVNSSMAYCGLYRPTDEYKGYYVVVDEGYGTDEVKEVSFEDQYLTDVLQLINTTFELDYYWDGNVCHVGKVQHDLTDTPIKYGSSDALISVSKENANYKIVDMITGYGSSDNLPYYYPNDDEFGDAVFDVENINKDGVSIQLSKMVGCLGNANCYNNKLTLYNVINGKELALKLNYASEFYWASSGESSSTDGQYSFGDNVRMFVDAKSGVHVDFSSLNIVCVYNGTGINGQYKLVTEQGVPRITIRWKNITTGEEGYVISDKNVGTTASMDIVSQGIYQFDVNYVLSYKSSSIRINTNGVVINLSAQKSDFTITKSGYLEMSYTPNYGNFVFKDAKGGKFYNLEDLGITMPILSSSEYYSAEYKFDSRKEDVNNSGSKVDVYYVGLHDADNGAENPVSITVIDRVWIAPSSVLMPSIYRNTKGAERFYYALNNTHKLPSGSGYYEFVNLYKKGNPHQGTVTFGNIKPTIKGIVNAEGQLFGEIADVAFDSADSDVKDSDGNYIHSYFYIKLHKFNGDFGFDLFAHALASESAKINLIKSNGCPACSFVIYNKPSADNSKCYNCVSVDENGNLKQVRTDKNDYIFANASDAYEDKLNQDSTQKELWIAVQKDTSTLGIVMPNASAGFKPQKGDLFVITGIKPPKVLVTAAEKRLDDALIKHMSENNTDQFNYSVKFSRVFLQENTDFASKLNENAKLSIQIQGDSDSDGNLISHEVFVSNYSVKVDNDELAEVEIELVNSLEVTKSDTKQIIDAVKGETVKSLSSMVGGSNTNSFNASITDKMYLSKLKDDTANGTITFQKVQKFLQGLLVGGGSWTPDAEGRSHLITDYLEVRMKAIFEELVINKTSTIGGKEIISPAGGVVANKVEEVTVTYNNVSQKAYRCYFLAEQEGDAVDNDFAIGDQVRSESFNVRKGTYHKAGNHFYWRLAIGRDEEPVELEGKKYHYIDLSDTDCATASDVPAKGDVLNQCGNRTDVERQNCLIFSAVDTYSPSVSLYHGINSYSFANREYVEYGVNKQTNKAFFNVYGDMYVGDRPTKENNYEGSSYIKYDSATKQVSVKGKISAKSTVDGKELSQYIKENSAKGLTEEQVNNLIKNSQVIVDLQNQVDGAIETWFYDGVPTLSNKPASDWKTDKDKNIHLGDLYYDNKTGKAYRFAKDGNIYKWTIITDTDIAKALSDASKAQETADGKMKVFSTQPTPPYQLGDIWVNATYPTDGSIYKNEVLRCQTNKAAGSQFAIADWIKASKYTDDTVANAAKAAAEKAQKAAETAQTNVTNLGKTVTSNKKAFDSYVSDGYLEPSEIAAMAQDSKRLEDAFAAAEKSYTEVKGAEVLKSTKELTDLNTAFTTLTTAKKELIEYLSDISARYNAADTKGKATIVSAVGTKFTNFQSAYSAFYDKLGLANAYITSKIYGDLKQNITDLAGYKYIKDALGQTTDIDGGLVMTTLLALRDAEGNVQSGINGAIDPNRGKKSIATWWGGRMVDKDYNSGNLTPATSLIRFDGSGYLANGAIWWDVSGKVHADPTSFIISEKNLGAYLTFFEPTWKAGSAGTSVADLVSLKPNAPFTKLGVSGDATFEGAISFHGIKLTYDATNKAIKIDGNLYATGGISAYGASDATSGGGGLNASVISYARIIEGSYTDADLTSIPNAYAIKALSSRIDNIATELGGLSLSWNNITGKPSTFAPSAHTHKWAEITDRITKVSQLTNDAGYLTAHQSLASYYTKAEIDAKGYTTNKGTVTSVALTLPTGLTCATKTITTSGTFAISLASGYSIPTTAKQTAWDGAVSAKHTHSNKSVLDGISSTKVSHWDSAYGWYALMTTDEETADGVINKWNEVVSFLANIAQTDTLSGIVDGINKSISDEVARAKKAEGVNASGISANKGSIATLQGYFTNGSAKKALQLTNARKLWGNSFNGTADINGSIIVPSGKYISIGNIKLEYDATNKALKITNTTTNEVANLYTSGGVSAYGVGTSSSSGGGLNGSVKSYSDALKLTSESLSEVASAYSIKALDSRISSLEGGSATAISVSGSGNAVTSVTKNGTTISIVKGSTFLTNHQSLDGYVNAISVSGSGNAITSVSKSGKGITFTKGATFLTSHQSLANYYTKSSVDSLLSGKSATSHTHSVKINGITKTIAASGGDAVDLGTYLTAHQSLAAYATQNWVKNEATAHNADMVDNYHASGLFTGFSISDVANKVTISIGGTSKALNLVRAFPSGVGNNFNDIATHGNSMGMSNIAAPYASSTANYQTLNGYVNPNGQTGWHHYINLSYTDSNNTATSPNMWQTQFAIKAGTTEVYVRSRAGGKISNDAAWAAPWVRLARVTDNVASASKVANALSWSGYSSGSYNGSAVKSISIPNNTNQLTNGAGFITSSASITGNAGSATKLQNARTINGTSFNGTANIVTSYWGTTRKLWGNSVNGNADVNGSITIANTDGVYVQIGDVRLVYDKANTAIKVVKSDGTTAANFYATGGISAYGEGSAGTTGSNNFSAKAYADSIKLTSENLSEIASAYSIAVLNNSLNAAIGRISTLEGGSATSIETTGSGNAVTSVSKSGTKITFTKGSTFSLNGHTHTFASLTSKPTSLSGYGITDGVNAVSVTGSGNAVTAASVSGHTLTLTKGSSFSLSNHTHYIGTTQVQGSSAEQALTGITKIDNILKLSKASVTVNTSYKAEQNRLVIYGSTYGNDANYIKSAGKLSYGDGGPQLVFSTGENPDASGAQSAALVYTDHDTIGAGVSLSFVTNQGDAYFIAPHIKALTAFQGNLAWSYITNKPTTLSGFGITDGLRSVTQPSGSNVFVTGISTSGTAITYTKSYTKKSLSAVGTSGWTNASTDGNIIPDMSFIAYWNGAYGGTSSNLAYCNKGAFGSFAIKNSLAFSELTSKPTTISGYGITDAYTKSQVDAIAAKYLPLTGGTLTGQLKIVASALNGAYNGLRIGDDCYIGDCNLGNTIGLMGVSNNNAGMVKFGKGGMQFGYNGSNHIASTTAQWTNLNADLLDGWHKDNIVWSGAVNSNTASLSHYWAKLFDITVTGNQYDDRSFTFLFSNGYNDTYSVVVLRIRQNGAKDSGAYNFSISLRELVGNMSSRLRVYYNNATGNVQLWGNCQGQYGSLSYTIIKKTGRTSADFTSQGTLVTNTSFSEAQSLPATTGDSPYTLLDGATRIGIVKQADQLVTARSLWGQSFNGTANVSGNMTGVGNINTSAAPAGTIYTNNWFRSKGSTGWYSEDHGGGWYMSDNTWIRSYGSKDVYLSNKLSVNGNVGIGTTAPSHKLHVLGEIYTTTKVNINGIILEKDSNGDLKVNGNLYATGGISAYGTSSAGSGGGLSGSVLAWDSAIKMPNATNGSSDTTKMESSFLASAWSIKQLYNKVTSLEGGSAMNVSVSGSGNAVTSISKSGTTISVVKGSTFSLSGHTHKWADITDRPSSLKNPSALSWSGYSSGSYDGSAAKSISIPNNTNQLTNGAGFITASASITGNAATATKVNHSLSVFGKSFNGSADVTVADTDLITSISTATANLTDKTEILTSWASDNGFNDSNAKNRIYRRPASAIWGYINSKTISNADKLDNVHLNGIFTALNNTNNGVSMTIGTVAKSLANMQVYSATKLVTARNIALNGDLMGNANFDGSANITINGYMSYCNAIVSNTNTYPWRRIAKVNEITGNWSDGCILLYISEGFIGGSYGIARVYIRTDNLSTGANASCSIQWISRNGYGLDSLKIAMYKTTGKAYYDVFLKMRGTHASVVIRTLQDQRGGLGKRFTLVNSTEASNAASHTEAYSTIEDAATAIHNQAYTSIAQGSDVAMVHNADMVDGIHASGLFTNLSNSGNSLSITVGGTNKTLTVNYASNAGNADTVDSLHVHSGRNSEANKIVRTDGNGFIQCGYINSDKGNEGNNSSPARVWGTNGSDNYLRSYLTSALSVKYAASAGNADTLDGVHASGLFTNLSNSGNNISITIGGTNKTLTAAYATNCDTVDGYHAQSGSSKPYGKIPVIGTDGVIELGHYIDFHHDNTTGSDYSVRLQTNGNHGNVVTLPTATGTLALTSDNVASATKLQTARTIWGQSFNGTANVSGALSGATTISASNTISTTLQNGALKIGNKSAPISAIDAQVIFNTGAAIRFGETNWDWNQWAGLKYTHSNKTVYLGIADGSVFNANNAQSGGRLQLKAIDRILFDSDSDSFQIHCDNNNDYLRIGSSDNSGYVLVSDIGNWDTNDNGDDTNNWRISINGFSWFKRINCPSIYTANSITSTPNKALLLSGNVIREYHSGGSPYYSSITFNETTLALNAYGNIGLTSSHGITIEGGSGTISMVASGGFDVTYRAASLSVSQTGASEYTWTFNNGSIKTTGGITAYQSSDERLKHNIHGVDSLAIIKAMGGTVAFRYNADNKDSIGWIAQRVLHNTFMQDLVEKDDKGFLKINYWSPKLIAVAFGAIEQVDDEVSRLKRRVRDLENEVEQLKSDRL